MFLFGSVIELDLLVLRVHLVLNNFYCHMLLGSYPGNRRRSVTRLFLASLGIESGVNTIQPQWRTIRLSDGFVKVPTTPIDLLRSLAPQIKLEV